jgi:hypothetical protein
LGPVVSLSERLSGKPVRLALRRTIEEAYQPWMMAGARIIVAWISVCSRQKPVLSGRCARSEQRHCRNGARAAIASNAALDIIAPLAERSVNFAVCMIRDEPFHAIPPLLAKPNEKDRFEKPLLLAENSFSGVAGSSKYSVRFDPASWLPLPVVNIGIRI